MDGSLVPLPPRSGGRAAKRRRVAADDADADAGRDGGAAGGTGDEAGSEARAPPYVPRYALTEHYEYLDHTADVQLHSWGATLGDAMIQNALAMFGYMTEPEDVEVDPTMSRVVEAKGHDLISLMFNFLDACLYAFASGELIVKDFALLQLAVPGVDTGEAPVADAAVDAAAAPSAVPTAAAAGAGAAAATPAVAAAPSSSPTFLIRVACYGERFSLSKHRQGTEIKAITYSNMQIITPGHTYTANADSVDAGATAAPDTGSEAGATSGTKRLGVFDIYVIVDI